MRHTVKNVMNSNLKRNNDWKSETERHVQNAATRLIHSFISLKSTMTKRTAADTPSKIQSKKWHKKWNKSSVTIFLQ